MKLLLIGAGVVGTVYGAHLGAAGHTISVLAHGTRTDAVENGGLRARDVLAGVETRAPAVVIDDCASEQFDLVLVALRSDHLGRVARELATLPGQPLFLFFGNNPSGRAALPSGLPGPVLMGFPGVGGTMNGGVAEYARIAQQPTALDARPERRLGELQGALERRGFSVQRVPDMTGWLAYHALFVASVSAALYHCHTDPQILAADGEELTLMCRAITEGFRALRRQGVGGLPRNLAVLHSRALLPVAVRYWARSMRSPMGELAFAAHARHAEPEMRLLARDVLAVAIRDGKPASLYRLLAPG